MVNDLKEEFKMKGNSGEEYIFHMYGFATFDDLQDFFKDDERQGVYVFTLRSISGVLIKSIFYEPVYVGETGNFSDRNFATHHKRTEIEGLGVHSFGIMTIEGDGDEKRKEVEEDILSANEIQLNVKSN